MVKRPHTPPLVKGFVGFQTITRTGSDDWEISHQDACDADKLTGLEDFGVLLRPLGLTEKKPVPDPIAFTEPDPLGAMVYSSADPAKAVAHKGS